MTVTTAINYKEYEADGLATRFAIPFLLLDKNDLTVYLNNEPITIGYTVRGLGNPISEIIFSKAPNGRLLLQRTITLVRKTDYQENGDLLADTLNKDFDRLYLAMQGVDQVVKQSVRVSDAVGIPALPLADERKNKLLSFDDSGNPIMVEVDSSSATALAINLKDATSSNKGSAMMGYNGQLNYPIATVGYQLNTINTTFSRLPVSKVVNTIPTKEEIAQAKEGDFWLIYGDNS